jgi:small subunit ribosomal protein S8
METIIKCLNEIINGQKIGANSAMCLYSKTIEQILNILANEGFIRGFFKEKTGTYEKFYILLKYVDDQPAIRNVIFDSRPGFKSFKKWKDLNKCMNGTGILIMSTNKGIITNEEAFYKKVGGQCLFKIY